LSDLSTFSTSNYLIFDPLRLADDISTETCFLEKRFGDTGSSFLGESLPVYLFLELTPKMVRDLAVVLFLVDKT
jgi:hypothetical protein